MTTDTPSGNMPEQKARRPRLRRVKNMIAVASGKGGVGKTWFSITLTHALARAGQKVLLFDGDLGLANVDVQLGLMPKRDLCDVIEGRLSLARAVHHYEEGGFDILAGRSGQSSLSALPGPRLSALRHGLMELADDYDVMVVDLGAGIDRTVRMMAASSGTVLVVTTDEPTSLTDAYAFIKLSHSAGHDDNLFVVINQAQTTEAGDRTYGTLKKACNHFLRINPPLAGLVHRDNHVRDSIRHQTPILIRSPNAEAAEDVERIADKVLARVLAGRRR